MEVNEEMRRIISILIFGMLLLSVALVTANESHESGIEKGRKLVESEISCEELTDEQLETIGDYYMEQMHPGKSHELMHDMMGGHDSKTTKLMHINMAKGIYCDEDVDMMNCGMMGSGMMGGEMMPMMDSGDMMDDNMMDSGKGRMMSGNMISRQASQTNMMPGMMGNLGYFGYWNFINVLYVVLIIGLIMLVVLGIKKLWR